MSVLPRLPGSASLDSPSPHSPVYYGWLDVLRLVAAFGVVTIHLIPREGGLAAVAGWFVQFSVFFFLAAGLFFAADSCLRNGARPCLQSRSRSLLGMLAIWSAIHLVAQLFRHPVADVLGRIPQAFLTGSAGVHLYFLPALWIGTLLLGALWTLQQQVRLPTWGLIALGAGTLLALEPYRLKVPASPTAVSGDASPAFMLFARVGLAWGNWILWTLPYACFALAMHRIFSTPTTKLRDLLILLAAVSALLLCSFDLVTGPLRNSVAGWSGFAASVAASRIFPFPWPRLARWLGFASIVIYLTHHLAIEAVEELVKPRVKAFCWNEFNAILLMLGIGILAAGCCVVSLGLPRSVQGSLWGHCVPGGGSRGSGARLRNAVISSHTPVHH